MHRIFLSLLRIVLVSFIVMFSGTVIAQEAAFQVMESESPVVRGQQTYFAGYESRNVPVPLRQKVALITEKNLARLKGCTLIEYNDVRIQDKSSGCLSRNCVKKTGIEYDAERIVYASIAELRRTVSNQIDNEGYGQYLILDNETVKYQVSLELFDKRGAKLISLTEKALRRNLDKTIADMVDRLSPFFKPVIVEPPPLKIDLREEFAVLALDYLGPINKFTNMSRSGGGITLGAGLMNYFLEGSTVILECGYGYYRSDHSLIDSLQTFRFGIGAGYYTALFGSLSINPVMTLGFHTSIVRESSGSLYTFTDPLLHVECPILYKMKGDYSLFLSPAFMFFFENRNLGTVWSVSFGVRYLLSFI